MWNDVETTDDYLHFSVFASTIAELIVESGDNPISVGVSGNWGSGKSSMVKMIGKELEGMENPDDQTEYIFLEFNAWLYQGYDDAKDALLQVVAKKLSEEMKHRRIKDDDGTFREHFSNFLKRINWFRVSKIALPLLAGLIPGVTPAGAVAALASSIIGKAKHPEDASDRNDSIGENIDSIMSEFSDFFKDDDSKSTTRQIEELRADFEMILEKMNVKFVILVDDLDRCLPETAISTLEAIRLLLFVKRTAFIIAADEQMIRNGVRAHFGNIELSDELVTSYFDKLIQIPITVPRLGIAEVKVYMFLLFLDLETRRKNIRKESQQKVRLELRKALSRAWEKDISLSDATALLETEERQKMEEYRSISEQLASILVSANRIKGNPRLIKRFLNSLEIRKKIANQNGMTFDSGILIKMLLFERCASGQAFDYLTSIVAKSKDGKPEEIVNLEESLKKGEEFKAPNSSWNDDFIKEWILLKPNLSQYDLRPLLYLSKDKTISFATYDKLSAEGEDVFKALGNVKGVQIMSQLVDRIKSLGAEDAETLLHRVFTIGRGDQWSMASLGKALHIIRAYQNLGKQLSIELSCLPASSRKVPIVIAIQEYSWAKELLVQWKDDIDTPKECKNAIK